MIKVGLNIKNIYFYATNVRTLHDHFRRKKGYDSQVMVKDFERCPFQLSWIVPTAIVKPPS